MNNNDLISPNSSPLPQNNNLQPVPKKAEPSQKAAKPTSLTSGALTGHTVNQSNIGISKGKPVAVPPGQQHMAIPQKIKTASPTLDFPDIKNYTENEKALWDIDCCIKALQILGLSENKGKGVVYDGEQYRISDKESDDALSLEDIESWVESALFYLNENFDRVDLKTKRKLYSRCLLLRANLTRFSKDKVGQSTSLPKLNRNVLDVCVKMEKEYLQQSRLIVSREARAAVEKIEAKLEDEITTYLDSDQPLTTSKFRELKSEYERIEKYTSVKDLKFLYAHLDSAEIAVSTLNSQSFIESSSLLIKDMDEHIKAMGNDPKAKLWKDAKAELEFAKEIDKKVNLAKSQGDLEGITNDVMQKLTTTKTGEGLILSGGYYAEGQGHAAIYQIQRETGGTFSLTVINTGEAATTGKSATTGKKHSLDQVFYGLTEAQLRKCITKLNEFNGPNFSDKDNLNMETVLKSLHELTKDKNGVVPVRSGNKHRLQQQGTCTVRCELSWLYSRVGRDAYRHFRPASMQRYLDAAKKEVEQFKHDHTWKLMRFGTVDDMVIRSICQRIFKEMDDKIKKAQAKIKQ